MSVHHCHALGCKAAWACCDRARVKVELFLDIPLELAHHLSKQRLRRADVKIDGANWPQMMVYCPEHGVTIGRRRK